MKPEKSQTGGIPKDRWQEIYLALGDSSLSPQRFVDLAFTFPEIHSVDLYKFNPGSYTPSALSAIKPGFETSTLQDHILSNWGPGRYSFKANINGYWVAQRQFPFGDFDEGRIKGGARPATSESASQELDPKQMMKEMLEEMKQEVALGNLTTLRADQEQSRLNRLMLPMQMMTALMDKMGQRPPEDGTAAKLYEKLLDQMRDEVKTLREDLRAVRTAPIPPAESDIKRFTDQVQAVTTLAAQLGMARVAEAAGAAPASVWTPADVKSVIDGASPILAPLFVALGRIIDAKATQVISQGASLSTGTSSAAAVTGGTMPQPPEFPPEVKDSIGIMLESLRTRDFETVLWVLENVFVNPDGSPIIEPNPKINPLALVVRLRMLAPEFDGLRAEVADFLKFVAEREAPTIQEAEGS